MSMLLLGDLADMNPDNECYYDCNDYCQVHYRYRPCPQEDLLAMRDKFIEVAGLMFSVELTREVGP